MISSKINLSEIPTNLYYVGYLWKSDEVSPHVYKNETLPAWPRNTDNPFIIEGNLYDYLSDISYSIRFIDGVYHVHKFEMKHTDLEFTSKNFIPNRIEGIQHLCFKQYWKPEVDILCEGLEVFKPAMNVFVGFNNKEK